MNKISIALDWTVNTNHSGFFVAREKGFYKEANLDVTIVTPDEDNYKTTPAKKVELGEVDFALCPMESVISYQTKKESFDLVALVALLQNDLSAIATLKNNSITSPRDLDGKTYASYKARYEDGIVAQMVKNDGGKGDFTINYPDKLGIWEILLKNNAHATWIFTNWEGLQAEKAGINLQVFRMKDYGIPYSYSPVIAGSASKIDENSEHYTKFLKATKQGFLYAINNPEESVHIIKPLIGKQEKSLDLLESQRMTNAYYGDEKTWGKINLANVEEFISWLKDHKLEQNSPTADQLVYKNLSF